MVDHVFWCIGQISIDTAAFVALLYCYSSITEQLRRLLETAYFLHHQRLRFIHKVGPIPAFELGNKLVGDVLALISRALIYVEDHLLASSSHVRPESTRCGHNCYDTSLSFTFLLRKPSVHFGLVDPEALNVALEGVSIRITNTYQVRFTESISYT